MLVAVVFTTLMYLLIITHLSTVIVDSFNFKSILYHRLNYPTYLQRFKAVSTKKLYCSDHGDNDIIEEESREDDENHSKGHKKSSSHRSKHTAASAADEDYKTLDLRTVNDSILQLSKALNSDEASQFTRLLKSV